LARSCRLEVATFSVVAIGWFSSAHARLSESAQRVIDLHNGTEEER
jgi:hypothetical protein